MAIEGKARQQAETGKPVGCTCQRVIRSTLADGVDALSRAGAAAIVLDLTFDTGCPLHDRRLSEAMKRAGNVVVAMRMVFRGEREELGRPLPSLTGYRAKASAEVRAAPHGPVMFVNAVQGTWNRTPANAAGDSWPVLQGMCLPLAVSAVAVADGKDPDEVDLRSARMMQVGGRDIPLGYNYCPNLLAPFMPQPMPEDGEHAVLINWWGPPGTFPKVPLDELLAGKVLPHVLRGAIAVVGDPGELVATPFTSMPGMEVQANLISTVLERRWIQPLSVPGQWASIAAAAAVAVMLMVWLGGFAGGVAVAAEVIAIVLAGRVLLSLDTWLMSAPVAMGAMSAGLGASFLDWARQRRGARELAAEMSLRDEVASEVVHDIRGHLTIIATVMERLLRHLRQNPELQVEPEVMRVIRRQLKALDAEAATLLDADPDRPVHLRAADFALRPLLEEAIEDVRAGAPRHAFSFCGEDVELHGDPGMIGRAVLNLLNNAVKYSPEGGRVDVTVESDHEWVAIRVRDEGMGIPPEKVSQLFRRFSRVVPEGVNIPGTGLGLYSAQRTIGAHGGVIEVQSVPGVGSVFSIRLPRRPGHQLRGAWQDDHDAQT